MSSGFTGFVNAALQIGLETVLIQRKNRGIFSPTTPDGTVLKDISAQAVISELSTDELEITEHPVEIGASISDHAFKRPKELLMKLAWSNSPSVVSGMINSALSAGAYAAATNSTINQIANLAAISYAIGSQVYGSEVDQVWAVHYNLIQLQESRALFNILTGKRAYQNMMCKSLLVETDFKTENALFVTMACREVILVKTRTVSLPQAQLATGSKTLASAAPQGPIQARIK